MDIDGRISQANGRLKAANVGITIERNGGRLNLRGTLPPPPNAAHQHKQQRRIYGGWHANPAGLKLAESEARKISALLDCGEFDWLPYIKQSNPETIQDWVERFERDYFQRRERTAKSQTTWDSEYRQVFKTLPLNQPLTADVLRDAISGTTPDTRTRKRFVMVLSALAKFAGLECDLSPLKGRYSPHHTEPRNLPTDSEIVEWFGKIPDASWRWAFGMLACYGLRNHELFHLDCSKIPMVIVKDGTKTDFHRVYPLYPEWVDEWQLKTINLPNCTGKTNRDLGSRVTQAFRRYGIPFSPYDLRHCWAIRAINFGLPVELASQMMGHSVQVHCSIYHQWISEEFHQRAFEALMLRSDRPTPPQKPLD